LPVEPADHALGRSKGGRSTKIHTLTDQQACPVTVILTPGQAGDNPQLVPLLDLHRQQRPGPRSGATLLTDKAYSHPSTRKELRRRRTPTSIPQRKDQHAYRIAKGSRRRPPAFDAQSYTLRNTVERGYARLRQWPGIATCYDKHTLTFLGGVQLAASVLHLR